MSNQQDWKFIALFEFLGSISDTVRVLHYLGKGRQLCGTWALPTVNGVREQKHIYDRQLRGIIEMRQSFGFESHELDCRSLAMSSRTQDDRMLQGDWFCYQNHHRVQWVVSASGCRGSDFRQKMLEIVKLFEDMTFMGSRKAIPNGKPPSCTF